MKSKFKRKNKMKKISKIMLTAAAGVALSNCANAGRVEDAIFEYTEHMIGVIDTQPGLGEDLQYWGDATIVLTSDGEVTIVSSRLNESKQQVYAVMVQGDRVDDIYTIDRLDLIDFNTNSKYEVGITFAATFMVPDTEMTTNFNNYLALIRALTYNDLAFATKEFIA